MSDEELINRYDFKVPRNGSFSVLTVFKAIPVLPKTITYVELANRLGISTSTLRSRINSMPQLAPVAEIDSHTLARLK